MSDKNNPFLDTEESGKDKDEDSDQKSLNKQALQDDENDISVDNISSNMSDDEWNAILHDANNNADDKIAEKQERRKKIKKVTNILMGAAVVVIILLITIFSIQYLMTITGVNQQQNTTQQIPAGGSQSRGSAYTDSNGGKNPASASNISYATTSTDSTVSVDHKKITILSKMSVSTMDLSSLQKDISAQPCELKSEASSCYLGSSQYGGKDVDIFAFRDAAKSSLLLTSNSVKKQSIQGTALAYSQKVSVDGKDKNALIIINTDQTGILLVGDAPLAALDNGTLVSSSSTK